MRDGYTRAREIEEAASGLVAWSEEFVVDVKDCRGLSIHADFMEFIAELKEALGSLDEDPGRVVYRDKSFWETEGHLTERR